MIETKVKVDAKVQEELNQKSKIINIIFMLIGTIGLIAYIILSVVLEPVPTWLDIMLLFAAFLGIGIVGYFVVKKTNEASKQNDMIAEITFNDDYYVIRDIRNGEEVAMQKVFYKDVCQVRETKNYLFIRPLKVAQVFHTVDKNAVSAKELLQIKAYLKKDKKKKFNI